MQQFHGYCTSFQDFVCPLLKATMAFIVLILVLICISHLDQKCLNSAKQPHQGPFIYYLTTFWGFLDLPPPISAYVIYEWSSTSLQAPASRKSSGASSRKSISLFASTGNGNPGTFHVEYDEKNKKSAVHQIFFHCFLENSPNR